MKQNVHKRSLAYCMAQFGRYAIPFYPVFKTVSSIKRTIGSGIETAHRLNDTYTAQRRNRCVLTFRQALAQRPANALSIDEIKRHCLLRKRGALIGGFLSFCALAGSVLGENTIAVFLSGLAMLFCGLAVVKYAHRLWQIKVGLAHPDQALGSLRAFFSTPSVLFQLLDPCLFQS